MPAKEKWPAMPESDPFYLKILEKLGFNVTRLRWRLFKLEQRRERMKEDGVVPNRLKWLQFRHKICRQCGALNDRDATQCYKCDRHLPSLLGYRIGRVFGFMIPGDAPHAITTFAAISALFFVANIALEGFGALLHPSFKVLYLTGGFLIDESGRYDWWRAMTFGVVHSGLLHIGFNTYAMIVLSALSENHLGGRRTLVLITASQIGAAIATWFWYFHLNHAEVFTMGASGWVSGLLGYALVYTWSLGSAGVMYRRQLTQWAVYILIFGIFMGANNVGHIGGALGGAVVGYLVNRPGPMARWEPKAWETAFGLSLALWLVCFGYELAFFAQHAGQLGAGD